jgi:hypothetical protein
MELRKPDFNAQKMNIGREAEWQGSCDSLVTLALLVRSCL